jgi:Cu(I)/Ag(I) efflux system membrane fusion protein
MSYFKTIFIAIVALLLGSGLTIIFIEKPDLAESSSVDEPLYWVAPMDSNFRKDKPGKSPMGMDLIAVYPQKQNNQKHSEGSVIISPQVENNIGVRKQLVTLEHLNNVINTVGYVRYDEYKIIHIHPRVEGWIEELHVKSEGDQVKKGQALYSLYSPELVNVQEEYILALKRKDNKIIRSTEARLLALNVDPEFIKKLKKSRVVHKAVTFYSSQNGFIKMLSVREGFFAKPDTTLMSIGQLDEVWVEAEVFARQAAQIKEGLAVTMLADYFPGHKWQGKVDYVYPSLDPVTRTLRLRLRFANSDFLLKPDMYTQVNIVTGPHNKMIAVPKESVIRTGKQDRVVLALGEGRFKSVAVLLGRQGENLVEIIEGLKVGDSIVTSAQFLLDSESSKSSDFKRMDANLEENSQPQIDHASMDMGDDSHD